MNVSASGPQGLHAGSATPAGVDGEECRLQTHGVRLAGLRYRIGAPQAGDVPVVALHGWLDNARSFDRLAGEYRAADWLSLDFPGHGHSGHRPAGCFYHFVDYVADVLGALDALGHDRVTLVGHSMGAGVASLFAAAFPERVAQLVMIDGIGPLSSPPEAATDELRRATEALVSHPSSRGRRYGNFNAALEARRAASPDVAPDALHAIVERNVRAVGGGYDWATDARLRIPSPHRYAEQTVRAVLGRITVPTLAVVARDGFVRHWPEHAERVKALRDPVVVRLEGGHHLHTTERATDIARHMAALCRAGADQ